MEMVFLAVPATLGLGWAGNQMVSHVLNRMRHRATCSLRLRQAMVELA